MEAQRSDPPTAAGGRVAGPLSFGQERFWILSQLDPDATGYNDSIGLRLEGALDPAVLAASLRELRRRHEVLRTVFATSGGKPRQVVLPDPELPVAWLDLTGLASLPLAGRAAAARRQLERLAAQPFDLSRGPLVRATVARLGGDVHLLHLCLHHAVYDAVSREIILRELDHVYGALARGAAPSLPPLPMQYADYAREQHDALERGEGRHELAYWRDLLADLPEELELPRDRPRPRRPTFRGGRHYFPVPPSVSETLRERCRQRGASSFMLLLAVFLEVLHRYSGQRDLFVGTTVSSRYSPELQGLVGFFINNLVLRLERPRDPSFDELLQAVRRMTLSALDHQEAPFERLVAELRPERHRSRHPLFQVVFMGQPVPLREGHLGPLAAESFDVHDGGAKFDLVMLLHEGADVAGGMEYARDLFDHVTAVRLARHYLRLLSAVLATPERRLSEVGLLDAAERHQLLHEWNDTAVARDPEGPFHPAATLTELVFGRAARQIDAAAVCAERDGETVIVSYGEMAARSHRLARHLAGLGLGTGDRVAVFLDRSPEMIPALLGVLAAGAAYVPLETSYPAARLEWILGSLDVTTVITEAALLGRVEELDAASLRHVVAVDASRDAAAAAGSPRRLWGAADLAALAARPLTPRALAGRPPSPSDLAYVIFTSGSTGTPKGVIVDHRAVVNLVAWVNGTFGVGSDDRLLFVTSLCFDLSVYDVFGLLAAGGTVHVATADEVRDPERLAELLLGRPLTFWDSAPAALMQVVPFLPEAPRRAALRRVFLSGDWIPVVLPGRLRTTFENVETIALGGATEATVWSNFHQVGKVLGEVPPDAVSIPYGRPIDNARYHVLDAGLRPVPMRVPGDLFIAGTPLAVAYTDPRLSAEKLVPDALSGGVGERLYRTGDRASYFRHGELQFLGRLDHQVKIRGFRIELGEIEAQLQEHPAVRDAVVLAQGEPRGERRLLACVSPRSEAPEAPELREFLAARLPDYMVPSGFVVLPELPVTGSGKVDRARLLSLSPETSPALGDAPAGGLETEVAELFAGQLGAGEVGRSQSFFELGGHSLSAVRLIGELRSRFGVDLPLAALFETPTVAGLAAAVSVARDRGEADSSWAALPPLVPDPGSRYQPFPLTGLQQAYWVGGSEGFELGNVVPHVYGELDVPELDPDRLQRAWRRLIERHDMLRAEVTPEGEQRVLERVPAYTIARRDFPDPEQAASELAAIRREMSRHGPTCREWPPFELRVSTWPPGDVGRLHISVSLLIADAVSLTTLTDELGRLYRDPRLELPPLELTYRDYVVAREGLRDREVHRRAAAYWRGRLPTLPPAVELPLARDPAALASHHLRRRRGRLEPAAWQRFQRLAKDRGLTPTAALTALFAEVLSAWRPAAGSSSGGSSAGSSPGFTLNILYFNRLPLHPQVDAVVGNLSATLLLEVDPSSGRTFEQRAAALAEQLWRDLEHGLFTGVDVVRELHRARGGAPRAAMPVVMSSALNLRREEGGLLGLGEELVFTSVQTPQVWLDHQVEETPEGELAYNFDTVEELFPEGLIDSLFGAYQRLLTRVAEGPESWRAETFDLLPPGDRARWAEVNPTTGPPADGWLHTLFAASARRHPERPAVIAAGATLSYGELAARAAAVGRRLRRLGAGPGELVAVAMSKGWEQAVAVLGVLHAGAAYLPLDPAQPRERLRHLLRRGEVEIVLTQPRWRERLAESPVREVVVIASGDDVGEPVPDRSWDRPRQQRSDLAYVIFTSGSTGEPKGVMIEHAGAVNTVLDVNRRYGVGAGDRVLGLSDLSFDLSVYDLFGLWAAGGAVVLPDACDLREPERWTRWVAEHGVTLWNSVPALMSMWVDDLEGRDQPAPASLRRVMLSGDWIPVGLPDRVRALRPEVTIWSLGGATEASIWSIDHRVDSVDPAWPSIPYGRPMTHQSFHVLDGDLSPRPAWVAGELYIGGAGLARGYWRDPERTAASFITHPRTGERLYRTGDLGRYRPDGTIEFLGRVDFQVKVQGYRIELGEIETRLARHPRVSAAVVTAEGDPQGERRLVGYVVGSASGDELRAYLGERLPAYMIPSRLVPLAELPLSPNGKVDRSALPALAAGVEPPPKRVAPRGETERRLAAIWRDLLGRETVGAREDFFELGGHSLLAVRLMNRLRRELGVDLPLAALFEEPTVEHLARVLTGGRAAPSAGVRVPLATVEGDDERAVHWVHPVGGGVLSYLELARLLGRPSHGFQNLDLPASEDLPLEGWARRYRKQLDGDGPYLLAGWSMGGVVAFEMARQLAERGRAVGLVAMIDPPPPVSEPLDAAGLAAWFASDLATLWGRPRRFDPALWRDLPPDRHPERLHQALADADVTAGLDAGELARLFHRFQANARALAAYQPRPYPGPLTIYRAADSALPGAADSTAPSWTTLATQVRERVVPGDHYTALRHPHVTDLAARLAEDLADAG